MEWLLKLRKQAVSLLGNAGRPTDVVLRASADRSGEKLSDEAADELLRKAVARERVSLFLTMLAYEQGRRDSKGNVVKNHNGVRVRDGAVAALARSGKGTPFMRDHRQYDSEAKGGHVVESWVETLSEDGHKQVWQTVELTEPKAVERALRKLTNAVSIGLDADSGIVTCTACGTEVFSACYHWPFDVVEKKDGTKVEVEWEFSDPALRETSEVPIGAVQHAAVKEVRGELAAQFSQFSGAGLAHSAVFGHQPHPRTSVQPASESHMDPELLKALGLPADATLAQVLAAINTLAAGKNATAAELAIANTTLAKFEKSIAELQASDRQRREDEFIGAAFSSGRIVEGDKEQWRALFAADEKRAVELMDKRPANVATPVGQPRQSGPAPGAAPVITGGELAITAGASKSMAPILAQLAANPAAQKYAIGLFGFQDLKGMFPAAQLAASPTGIANNADLDSARIGFHAAFLQSLELSSADPIEGLYTTVPSSKNLEQHNWFGDLPGFEEWKGDRKMSGLEAFKLQIENKKWANGLRLKNDDLKDDALGLVGPQVQGLAVKAKRHRYDLMIKLLLNGFAGNAYPEVGNGLAYDGAFFFSDSHRGGNDNKLTVALDAAGLAAAELLLASMTTYDGNDPLDVYGTHLIVGPKLAATAQKLLTQERLANGEDNIYRGRYKVIVSNRIRGTYDDYWFLADMSQPIKPLLFQMREEISTSAIANQESRNAFPSFMNDELWFGAQARYNVAYFEFRTIVGSVVA